MKLHTVNEEKIMGVIITSKLKPARQCQQAHAKASKALIRIARTITYRLET